MNVLTFASPLLQGDEGLGLIGGLVYVAVIVYMIACIWMIFGKAGQPGWHALIPIWSSIVLLKIVGRPWWWILLMLVPFLNIVILITVQIDLGMSFGQGTLFSVSLLMFLSLIGMGVLAFGSARYLGPGGRAMGY